MKVAKLLQSSAEEIPPGRENESLLLYDDCITGQQESAGGFLPNDQRCIQAKNIGQNKKPGQNLQRAKSSKCLQIVQIASAEDTEDVSCSEI